MQENQLDGEKSSSVVQEEEEPGACGTPQEVL